MRSIIKGGLALLVLLALGTAARAATTGPAKGQSAAKDKSVRTLDANAWKIYTTNYGPFVFPKNSQPGGNWQQFGRNYIYGAGLYFGALDAGSTPHVACGYNPNNGGSSMGPVDPRTFSYVNYNINKKARVYLSTDPADQAEWPIKDANNNNVIKSIQDGYAVYSDENTAFTFTGMQPVGVRIKQWSYAWNYADNNDIVFFYFRVFNATTHTLGGCYVGPCFDADIGDESGTAANDRTDFDYLRNLAIQYQTDPEPGWDKVGYFGCRYFESPKNNNGHSIHITDDQFPHDIPDTMPLGMTAFKVFTIDIDMPNDAARYLEMQGINYKTMILDAYDQWGAVTPGDKRFLMASGPFHLAVGDSVATCCGVMCALDRKTLINTSDIAQDIYNNHFELAVPPVAPEITCIPGDKSVRLCWTRKSETTPDSYYDKIDSTTRWYNYFRGTWRYCGDTALVDSLTVKFQVNDSVAISTVIPRGGINPYPVNSDTTLCRYNTKKFYMPLDFQGYIVYRAKTQADLVNPAKREALGGSVTNANTNASGYFFDLKDGVQIVRDLRQNIIVQPDGTIDTLPVFDTIGTDRGLIYTLVDNNVINNFGYWYGISAYDYQKNVYFTRKCPTTLASNPASGSKFAAAMAPSADYKPSTVTYTTTGGADARALDGNGALDYNYNLFVGNPNVVTDTKYTIRWNLERKLQYYDPDTVRVPFYHGRIYDAGNNYIDSTGILPEYGLVLGSDVKKRFYGPTNDQSTFGGIIFRPYLNFNPNTCAVDSMVAITEVAGGARTYPADSVRALLDEGIFTGRVALWMWRGSDIEIRWRDTLVGPLRDTSAITCTVWDMANNVEIPFQGGLSRNRMTVAGWSFGTTATDTLTTSRCLRPSGPTNTVRRGMFISGLSLYFKRVGTTSSNISWTKRPETGDVWRIHCHGSRPPVDGNSVTFTTTSPGQVANLGSDLLNKVMVVPNPYLVRAKWDVTPDYPNLYFTNLPTKCTIRIYTMAGDLVRVLEHETTYATNNSAEKWNLLTTYNKRVASGLYIYQVDAPGIGTKIGKFAVIK